MKNFSPPQMKEVSFPTPYTPHPTPYTPLYFNLTAIIAKL
ncbi:DNA gyrase subunit A [Microcystis aeruginosa NIES-2481]|nr:DNA gyrase subunit A [Microcystis aeruginosa NIES-2481]